MILLLPRNQEGCQGYSNRIQYLYKKQISTVLAIQITKTTTNTRQTLEIYIYRFRSKTTKVKRGLDRKRI